MSRDTRPRLLHVTPHLGGGVGRAMVNLAESDRATGGGALQRSVLCLEPPQKSGAVERLRALSVPVLTLDDWARLPGLAASHDLLQFEVWNHPLLFAAWAHLRDVPMRAVFWCHVSGLHFPRLPGALWEQPFPVALTAPCSLRSENPGLQAARAHGQVQVISSAAGFEHWPAVRTRAARAGSCRLGYLGSLNLSKMHPDYVEWLAASATPWSRVEVLGDEVTPGALAARCRLAGRPRLLDLRGFCPDVSQILARWDAMVYLLNPFHYGTAELALLEAMASGVVPLVLGSPCETDVVRDGDTGWVLHNPQDLAAALARCRQDPAGRQAMGRRASEYVRSQFTLARQQQGFSDLHARALDLPRARLPWTHWIGRQPWQWFLSTLPQPTQYPPDEAPRLPAGHARHAHLESTKGSVHHFARCFPADSQLQAWSQAVLKHQDVGADLAA